MSTARRITAPVPDSAEEDPFDRAISNTKVAGFILAQSETLIIAVKDSALDRLDLKIIAVLLDYMDPAAMTAQVSAREIAEHLNIDVRTASNRISKLGREGYIARKSLPLDNASRRKATRYALARLDEIEIERLREKLARVASSILEMRTAVTPFRPSSDGWSGAELSPHEVTSDSRMSPDTVMRAAGMSPSTVMPAHDYHRIGTHSAGLSPCEVKNAPYSDSLSTHSSSIDEDRKKERVSDQPLDFALRSVGSDDVREAVEAYNVVAKRHGLSGVVRINDERRDRVSSILEQFGFDSWRTALDELEASEFLLGKVPGRDGKRFQFRFDWMTDTKWFVRIVEGEYRTRSKSDEVWTPEYFANPAHDPNNWPDPYGDD